jgi:hypothetical protein
LFKFKKCLDLINVHILRKCSDIFHFYFSKIIRNLIIFFHSRKLNNFPFDLQALGSATVGIWQKWRPTMLHPFGGVRLQPCLTPTWACRCQPLRSPDNSCNQ